MSTELFICAYKPLLSKNLITEVKIFWTGKCEQLCHRDDDIITRG